jgi:hypothetical protein
MFSQLKSIPYTAGQYCVNELTEVFDRKGNKIPVTDKDGKKFVKLNWYAGEKEYELGLLVLCAFGKIEHDYSLYDRVDVIYKDGNVSNCFPSNLAYRFSGDPIESYMTGFYLIPGLKRYVISRDGQVYDVVKSRFLNWSISKGGRSNRLGGYRNTSVVSENGSYSVSQHRLLGIVFLPFTGIFNKLTINHKDGVKSNNHLDNLEWITYAENNKHAWDSGLKLNNRPKILKMNLLTGKIDEYRSVRECAYSLGDKGGFHVAERIKDTSGKIYPDYLLFKRDDGSEWSEVDYSKIPKVPSSYKNAFVARNVYTGQIIIFDDLELMSKELDVPSTTIIEHVRCNQVLPCKRYNFRYLINADKWPQHTEKHLLVYKDYPRDPPDGVIVTDTVTGVETFFTSCVKASEAMALYMPYAETLCNNGKLFKKRYAFKWFKLKRELLEKTISSKA